MGSSYSVDAKISVREGMENNLVKAFKQFVKTGNARYHEYKATSVKTVDDVFFLLLAGHQNQYRKIAGAKSTTYKSNFDASYGWSKVMSDAFYKMSPFLLPKSELCFSSDNDQYLAYIGDDGEVYEENAG